jgi:hypothetical protein
MADTEGFVRIIQGDTTVVGDLVLNTGSTIPSGLGAGNMIFAQEVGLRANSAMVATANPLPTTDAATQAFLNTIATAETAGNVSLAAIATAQGNGASGVTIPTGGLGVLGWLSGIFQTAAAIVTALAGTLLFKQGPLTGTAPTAATGTGGTAVNIFAAGNVAQGGWFIPSADGFVNQIGIATTTAGGANVLAPANQNFRLSPLPGAVSFISVTGTVTIQGLGLS